MSDLDVICIEADEYAYFKCPGCATFHVIRVIDKGIPGQAVWGWNGDKVRPTFTPSILARWVEPTPEGEWMMDNDQPLPEGMKRYPSVDMVCHSFVNDGVISLLSDCTKNPDQKLPLQPWSKRYD